MAEGGGWGDVCRQDGVESPCSYAVCEGRVGIGRASGGDQQSEELSGLWPPGAGAPGLPWGLLCQRP